MYSLFQLVRLISIKDDTGSPKISTFAWRQNGERSILALVCTNNFIVLRYSSGNHSPVVKQLPWPPDHPITSLCFDPTVSWLLVQTENASLFIIPALFMLDPECQVNQLWRLDDVTIISSLRPRGQPTAVLWWHTLDDQHIAIMASKLGEILFVNLQTQKLVTKSDVDSGIKNLELVQDDQQITTHLLITGSTGIQWKMLLETRQATLIKPDADLSEMGYDNIDGMNLPITSILSTQAAVRVSDTGPFGPHTANFSLVEDDRFFPMRFYQFQRSECLAPQYAKSRHFISAHCDKTSIFKIYDSKLEHNPLFIYKLPLGSLKVIFSDRVIFTASKLGGEQKLLVLSNQKTETSEDQEKELNRDAILQQFDVSSEEKLIGVLLKSFPFYWHEKLEQQTTRSGEQTDGGTSLSRISAFDIHLTSHTVLDGCIIVTDSTVYECRPRISPERLCLELCISQSDVTIAEQLGISLSLDLNSLFEVAADYLLSRGRSKQANRLFQTAKSSPAKRIAKFAKHGFIQDVIPYLLQLLSKSNAEISLEEKKQLSDMALHGLVYQLKQDTEQTSVADTLRHFLVNSTDYEDTVALKLLSEGGIEDILFDYAMARGLVMDALEVLVQQGKFKLSDKTFQCLITKGYSAHIAQVSEGAFLQCLSPKQLVKIFHEKPQYVAQHSDLLLGNLTNLDLDDLLDLAEVLDPSRPLMRGFIHRKTSSRRRTSSISSLTGSGEFGDSHTVRDQTSPDAAMMLYVFLLIVLHLNKKRHSTGEPVIDEFLFKTPEEFVSSVAPRVPLLRQKLAYRPVPVSCGQTHAAFVKNGELFTWGKNETGRLGHGDQGEAVSLPRQVETFSKLQIRVMSVACGQKHTMALTQQGVYGWGSSQYGQVGMNTRLTYTRPMLVETLSQVSCVAIECGQYHTLALTDDAQVYSWGWGVHGQLGHGDVEERLTPGHIKSLANKNIVRIAGGYTHSIVLNAQLGIKLPDGYLLCTSSSECVSCWNKHNFGKQGEVYAFGSGFFGQLGLGNTQKHSTPVKVNTLTEKIIAIATKFFHNVALAISNRVYTWGCHPHGLRHFVHSHRKARGSGKPLFEQAESHLRPQLVDTSYVHGRIKQVACGSFHSCLITKDGDVYTWGRNLDGQIGNGTRTDVRLPQMVTHINDRNVTCLSAGGEFNVALDSDNQLWVWGRNEFGQLGMQHSDFKLSRGIKSSQTKNISELLTEVTVPVHLNLLSRSQPAGIWLEGSLNESFTQSISWDRTDSYGSVEETEDDSLAALPDLTALGPPKYDRMVLPIVLQGLSSLCNCNQLLRTCVDLEDWCSAAAINIHLKNYSEALSCHLKHLRQSALEIAKLSKLSLNSLQYFFMMVDEKEGTIAHKEEDMKNLLYQVFYHWEECNIPVSALENFLTENIEKTACLLMTILFQAHENRTEEKAVLLKPTLYRPSSKFLSRFSTKLCLKITAYVLVKLQGDMEKSSPLCFKHLSQFGGDHFENLPSLGLSGDKLSYDQIWQDIMQNIAKGVNAKNYIYVTHGELDRLEEQLSDTDQIQGQKNLAVFFTCGHYYTRTAFERELNQFSKEMKFGQPKLPETATLLSEYYTRKSSLPLACPKCVLNAINVL